MCVLYLGEDDRVEEQQDSTAPSPGVVERQHLLSESRHGHHRPLTAAAEQTTESFTRQIWGFLLFMRPMKNYIRLDGSIKTNFSLKQRSINSIGGQRKAWSRLLDALTLICSKWWTAYWWTCLSYACTSSLNQHCFLLTVALAASTPCDEISLFLLQTQPCIHLACASVTDSMCVRKVRRRSSFFYGQSAKVPSHQLVSRVKRLIQREGELLQTARFKY